MCVGCDLSAVAAHRHCMAAERRQLATGTLPRDMRGRIDERRCASFKIVQALWLIHNKPACQPLLPETVRDWLWQFKMAGGNVASLPQEMWERFPPSQEDFEELGHSEPWHANFGHGHPMVRCTTCQAAMALELFDAHKDVHLTSS